MARLERTSETESLRGGWKNTSGGGRWRRLQDPGEFPAAGDAGELERLRGERTMVGETTGALLQTRFPPRGGAAEHCSWTIFKYHKKG